MSGLAVRGVSVEFAPAVITADFDGMRAKLEEMIEPYRGLTPEAAASMDLKEAKACRADLNAMSKELNDARKAIKKAYSAPLAEFEEKVKELDALIKEPCALIDEAVKAKEQAEREGRRARLEEAFEGFLDANGLSSLSELIGFGRVLDQRWLNKTYGEQKAEDELVGKVSSIVADWQGMQVVKASMCFPEEAEREFWRTLSLRDACECEARLKAEQARIDALRAEMSDATEYREGEPETEPQAASAPPAAPEPFPVPEFEEARRWRLEVEATERQVASLVAWLKENGVHGTLKEVRNG